MTRTFLTPVIATLILIIGAINVFSSSSKETLDHSFTSTLIDSTIKYTVYPDTIILERNLNGKVTKFRINYSDSTYIICWKDGVYNYISDIHPYRNNKPHGLQQTYAPNGVLIHETPWVAGKIVGVERFWNDDGTLDWTRSYNDLGLLSDSIVTYYKSGIISSVLPFENGMLNGAGKAYDTNGNIRQISYYHFDTLKRREYYKDNILVNDSILNIYDPY